MMFRLRRRLALAWRHAGLLLHAVLAIAVIRLGLRLIRYQPLLRRIERARLARRPGNVHLAMWAIRHAARLVPGATCLTKALAGKYFCVRAGHPAVVRIGVQRRDGRVAAHAWLVDDHDVLIGGQEEDLAGFTPLVDLRVAAR